MKTKTLSLMDTALLTPAIADAFRKLSPMTQIKNPVMFVVYVGSIFTSGLYFHALTGAGEASAGFILAISLWLWFTVLFANFAEALAEGRSKAQAASLRGLRKSVWAKKMSQPVFGTAVTSVPSEDLKKGHVVLVQAGDVVPAATTRVSIRRESRSRT